MTIEVIGSYPPITRLQTGFYSLDRAFINDLGDLGVPIGHCWEIFGTSHTGKSTFTYSLSGLLATIQKRNIVLCDFEGLDQLFLTRVLKGVGFSGKVNLAIDKEDEDQIEKMMDLLSHKAYSIAILDSISAISPLSEVKSELGEANMGRRAFLMAQLSRKALHLFRFSDDPKTLIMINHWIPKIGQRGYQAPGGEIKSFLATTRILLKREPPKSFPDGSYVLEGEVVKNRWGFRNRKFYVFMLAARGMHPGLSALWDCVALKKATHRSSNKVEIITFNGADEKLSFYVKGAHERNDDIFKPFYQALAENTDSGNEQDEELIGSTDISDD